MSCDWKKIRVEEIALDSPHAMSTGPFGSAISSKFFKEDGVPVIRGGNLSTDISSRMSDEGLVFVSKEKAVEFQRSLVRSGDLIFTCWGTINQVGLINDELDYSEYIVSNKQMKLTPDPKKADSLFLYYLFSSPIKQAEIISNGIGAAVPGFNLGQLKSHVINLPPIVEQKRIANILYLFDRKIRHSRKINQTLEQMAQAIFKSWFVDFEPVKTKIAAIEAGEDAEGVTCAAMRTISGKTDDGLNQMQTEQPEHYTQLKTTAELFPAAMQDSELGKVPEGWDGSCFGNVIAQCKTKIKDRSATVLSAVASGQLVRSDEHFKKTVYSKSIEKYLAVEKWDFAYNPSRINIGSIGMYKKDELGAVSPVYVVFKPDVEYRWFIDSSLKLNKTKKFINTLASGGVRQSLSFNDFASVPSVIPSKDCISIFNLLLEKLETISEAQINEINTLTNLRDTLLPKLLSGELSVDAVDLKEEN